MLQAALKGYGVDVARLQTLDILSFNRAELGVAVVAIGERLIERQCSACAARGTRRAQPCGAAH